MPAQELPGRPRLLFLRHGIIINRWFLEPMARHFRRRGYIVHNRSYPSTRKLIAEHAADFHREAMDEIAAARAAAGGAEPEVYFITHSLGGLVLRWMLTHHEVPGARRAVLLVPPNRGSLKARHHADFLPFRLLYGGRAGEQVSGDPAGIIDGCGIPRGIDIGIIAGASSPPQIFPAPLPKPHDGVVALEETRLGGFPVLPYPCSHTLILLAPGAWREAGHFLEHGRFRGRAEPAILSRR